MLGPWRSIGRRSLECQPVNNSLLIEERMWSKRREGGKRGLTDEEQLSASCPLDDEPGNRCKDRVDDHVHTAEEERKFVCGADRGLEEDGEVVNHSITSLNLLHNLRARTKQHPSEMLCLASRQHSLKRRLGASARRNNGVQDDYFLEPSVIAIAVHTSKRSNDFQSFFVVLLRK